MTTGQVILGLLLLVAVDTLVAVVPAVAKGEFSLQKLPSVLMTSVIPLIGAPFLLLFIAASKPDGTFDSTAFTAGFYAAAVAAAGKLAHDIVLKVRSLVGA